MERVVVTAVGIVSPLGLDAPTTWQNLIAGKSGLGPITLFDAVEQEVETRIAGEVKDFQPEEYMDRKEVRRTDRFAQLALAAASEALSRSDLPTLSQEGRDKVGVIIGTGIGGLEFITNQVLVMKERGPRRVSPFTVPALMPNAAAAQVCMRWGFRGPSFATVSACSSAADAIGVSLDLLRSGRCEAIVTGGAEAPIIPISIAAFNQAGALSTHYNEEPTAASRPFDAKRDGFVMAEGAAVLVLERESYARQRGATILAELAGYGASDDAFHITAPPEDGNGAVRSMQEALRNAGITEAEIDYVNAHGTSTPINDRTETFALKQVFGERAASVPISSTKSMTGHMVGAAGAAEAIFCIMALREGIIPPTINHQYADPDCDLDYVPNVARRRAVRVAMSNSFGFGGHNSTLIFRRYEGDEDGTA